MSLSIDDNIDYYSILGDGLTFDSTQKELDRAYRKRAKEWHPDKMENKEKAGKAVIDATCFVHFFFLARASVCFLCN